MNKKLIIFIATLLITLFVIIYYFLGTFYTQQEGIFKPKSAIYNLIDRIPTDIKSKLKEAIFPYQTIEINKQKITQLESLLKNDSPLTKFELEPPLESIFINKKKYKVSRYTQDKITNYGPRSYLESNEEDLFLITGTGILLFSNLQNLNKGNLNFTTINTNLGDYIPNEILEVNKAIINDLLIDENKILVTLVYYNDGCYENLVLVGELNYYNTVFEELFVTNECHPKYSYQAGNRIEKFKEGEYLLTIGDFDRVKSKNNGLLVQDNNHNIGKLILIKDKNKSQIIAKGLRNSQGLYFFKEKRLIFMSDHGPRGGDEVNVIKFSDDNKVNNFGWPLASYGDHYDDFDPELYKIYPLYKSHKDYDFQEPLVYFNPSIGPSQIIKLNKKFINYDNAIMLSSLADESLYHFTLNSDYTKIIRKEKIPMDDRIRDLIYIQKLNLVALYLESYGSIVIISPQE